MRIKSDDRIYNTIIANKVFISLSLKYGFLKYKTKKAEEILCFYLMLLLEIKSSG